MNPKHWLTALAMAAVAASGPAVQAGLFDRLRERSSERDRSEEKVEVGKGDSLSFAVADEREIGKFIHPVTFQTLPAPAAADASLTPVPEPYLPAPVPSGAAYPGTPGEPYPIQGLPMPVYPSEGYPGAGPIHPIGPGVEGFPLYHRVRYKDLDNIHPCAVSTVVQVLDPCENPCDSCGPRCVFVKICVPANECPRIKVEDRGRKVKYKFDDYQVEIESEDGVVTVDYDD